MLRTGSLCASFLYNYLKSDSKEFTDENGTIDKRAQKVRCLTDTLQKQGGILGKLAQMLSLNDEDNDVFSNCKPFSKDKTHKYFKKIISEYEEKLDYIDDEIFKSGSVGQIYRCGYKDKEIIFKIQYVGLAKQIAQDLKIFETLITYLYNFTDLKPALENIKKQLNDELDYRIECINQKIIKELFKKNKDIIIPNIIPEFCSETIISMDFIDGKSITEFINNSTQEERNKIGESIITFIFKSLYKHNILYSDTHYGNFLITDENKLGIIDFGCVHNIEDNLCDNLKKMKLALYNKNKDDFYKIVEDIGIINPTISQESKDYIYDYFMIQLEPWITEKEFEFNESWLDKCNEKNTELMQEWTLPGNMVYFNKIPYGLYHILTKLKVKGNFWNIIKKLI